VHIAQSTPIGPSRSSIAVNQMNRARGGCILRLHVVGRLEHIVCERLLSIFFGSRRMLPVVVLIESFLRYGFWTNRMLIDFFIVFVLFACF